MQYRRYRSTGFYSGYFPPGVKWLLISNVGIFLLRFLVILLLGADPLPPFALVPASTVSGALWQPVTYLFLHGSVMHVLFNMLALWFFGPDLERDWGTRRFLRYYFLCGVGAAVTVILAAYYFGGMGTPTIGASGAIYGVLLAFGVLYPDRIILYGFLFPIKAKYFVMITGAVVFLNSLQAGGRVSHVAHLGGMVVGFLFLKLAPLAKSRSVARRPGFIARTTEQYKQWKLARARRKFQVYMKKHGDDGPDRWTH